MEFSWSIFSMFFVAGVSLTGLASSFEGTFYGDQGLRVNVPYVWHWGIGPSCFVLAVAAGYAYPVIANSPAPFGDHLNYYGGATLVSLAISAVLFWFWQPNDSKDDCPIQIKGKGVTITGCIFFAVFTAFLVILLFGYVPTHMPKGVVRNVSFWLVPWPFLGTLEVNWRVNRGQDNNKDSKKSKKMAWAITLGLELSIVILFFCKI